MKQRLINSLLVILVTGLCLSSLPTFSQEGETGPEEIILDPGIPLLDSQTNEFESKSRTIQRDTTQIIFHSAKPKNADASKQKAEEDPFSFNFLYFIIQKFKISDIIDD